MDWTKTKEAWPESDERQCKPPKLIKKPANPSIVSLDWEDPNTTPVILIQDKE
ncbi:hypothetical protein FH972_005721 [Carpinus fangiana]|uniref:Uncharacterized protein n=1 Tax=Carpinus fangiana TaxID=176857 RepID=A0A5N6QT11_9ROSI|nr:hypothetical protein FH972_005721 [Carpinus fangiana]